MQRLRIGDKFTLFHSMYMKGKDGCLFEALHGGGFSLIAYLSNMSQAEKTALSESITVKLYREDSFLLPIIRFGNTHLMFEVIFDPTLYDDGRDETLTVSNMLTIIGVESNSNIIKTLRLVSINPSLYKELVSFWIKAKNMEDFSKKYINWVRELDAKYTVLQLWSRSKYICKMGN